MLIEIYDYAAKLLNNMTARGVREPTAGGGGGGGEGQETINNESAGKLNLNVRGLLKRTLARVARANPAQHVTNLPVSALLLQALDATDVAHGQDIDPSTSGPEVDVPEQPFPFPFPNATGNPLAGNGDAATDVYLPAGNLSGFIESSTTAVMSTLPLPIPTSSTMATFQAQTVATFIAATGTKNRPTTIVVYPTGEFLNIPRFN